MPTRRLFLKMTGLTQTFTGLNLLRVKSLKVENLSFTGDTYKQLVYICMTGNPAAVLPAVPVDLCVNNFINQSGVSVDYTYMQRGDLSTTNIVSSNRQSADVVIENTLTDITALAVTVTAETGNLNVNASNPLCFEVLVEMYY